MLRKHIVEMVVEDNPGVLIRVAGLFARRNFNIDTISVGKTNDDKISKMIFTVIADDEGLEQVKKQLHKLIDVVKVSEMSNETAIAKELCFLKVTINNEKTKEELFKYSEVYGAKIIEITSKSLTYEIVDDSQKIDSLINLVKTHGIKELSRTGVTAIKRGNGVK